MSEYINAVCLDVAGGYRRVLIDSVQRGDLTLDEALSTYAKAMETLADHYRKLAEDAANCRLPVYQVLRCPDCAAKLEKA